MKLGRSLFSHLIFFIIFTMLTLSLRRAQIQTTQCGHTGNVWQLNMIKLCSMTKHFLVWAPCLIVFYQ